MSRNIEAVVDILWFKIFVWDLVDVKKKERETYAHRHEYKYKIGDL